jgi:putative transposase
VQWLIQEILDFEFSQFLGADPYERSSERQGYRNGYYPRDLFTRVGRLTLRVPRDREGRFSTEIFERYQRSEKALVLALQESYLQGVSTRKVKKITEKLCGVRFSTVPWTALQGRLRQHGQGSGLKHGSGAG